LVCPIAGASPPVECLFRFCCIRAAADRFHRYRFHDDVGTGRGEAELRLVRGLEGSPHPVCRVEVDVEGGIGALVAQQRARAGDDARRADALLHQLFFGIF
jgi:hypothetical protein